MLVLKKLGYVKNMTGEIFLDRKGLYILSLELTH